MQMTTEQKALRASRLAAILPATAAAFENGFEAQSPTPRYFAIEYSIGGPVEYKEAIWAYQYDDLVQIAQAIDASETADLGNTVVWDLDTNQQLEFSTRVVSFFDPSTKKRIDIPAPVTPRAFVEVSGGVVQNVGSDAPLQLRVIDYDTDFSDGQFVDVPQVDGTTGAAAIADWTISHGDTNYVSKMFSLPLSGTPAPTTM